MHKIWNEIEKGLSVEDLSDSEKIRPTNDNNRRGYKGYYNNRRIAERLL